MHELIDFVTTNANTCLNNNKATSSKGDGQDQGKDANKDSNEAEFDDEPKSLLSPSYEATFHQEMVQTVSTNNNISTVQVQI